MHVRRGEGTLELGDGAADPGANGQAARVLVLRFSSLGDVVLTTPAIEALHAAWPDTEIIYVVKEALAPLLRPDPRIAQVVPLGPSESLWSLGERLRVHRAEAVLDLHGKIRSRALRLLVGGRWVRWHKRPWRDHLPVRLGLRPYRARMPIATRYHRAVEALVGRQLPAGRLRVWPSTRARQEAQEVLKAVRGPFLAISPGANWATKRWPAPRFAQVAARAQGEGLQVVITGDRREAHLGEEIVAAAPRALNLVGQLSLDALVGVLEQSACFLGNDSGPLHVARALGVPTVALFGSTDPTQFHLHRDGLSFAGVSCSPCHFYGRSRCPKKHFDCMLRIGVDEVFGRIIAVMEHPRPAWVSA